MFSINDVISWKQYVSVKKQVKPNHLLRMFAGVGVTLIVNAAKTLLYLSDEKMVSLQSVSNS